MLFVFECWSWTQKGPRQPENLKDERVTIEKLFSIEGPINLVEPSIESIFF